MTKSAAAQDVAAALAEFEQELRRRNHPLLNARQPGLDPATAQATFAPTGLVLPDEAVELWGWANGTNLEALPPGAPVGSDMLPGALRFLPLDFAVSTYLEHQEMFPWDQLDDHWPTLFPVASTGHGDMLWIETAGAPDQPASLIYLKYDDYNHPEEIAAATVPSVAAGVRVWTALLQRGIWAVHDGMWQDLRAYDPDLPIWPSP